MDGRDPFPIVSIEWRYYALYAMFEEWVGHDGSGGIIFCFLQVRKNGVSPITAFESFIQPDHILPIGWNETALFHVAWSNAAKTGIRLSLAPFYY